ncbi:glucose 1-dehydrogenase [Acidisoma cellulosilytica]|uniref:Glucose 1-dehydrogenase n=1 Tax=Acidisoma cellulosilyticum TaxID=2802395 RepID=A0A964E479_9PROT|nr:glucose 1-dehydrogenase [Acidisoma cellulosilyticum]MCB8881415.1 glucose 1-dehydrogenase [Acidisoma cellulosilyticum]
MDHLRHAGKVALVTGGSSGIGLGIVERLLREGARIAILDLQPPPVDVLKDESAVQFIAGNAADEAVVDDALRAVVAKFGQLDIMVNNAGVIGIAPVVEMEFSEWRRVTEINLHSVFLGARAAARQMIAQGRGGCIINASSGAGRKGSPNLAHYCASKAAVIMLTQSLSVELAPHRIRVNAYAPGHIETPFWSGIAAGFSKITGQTPEEVVAGFAATIPWGRFGKPDDVASTVSWLASADADYVNGQTIAMNGAESPG